MGHIAWAYCARCGDRISLQPDSRPAGLATCRPCWLIDNAERRLAAELAGAARKALTYERPCDWCKQVFTTKHKVQKFCSSTCRGRSKNSGPCAECGKLMVRGRDSLPVGEATCRPCRRARNKRDPDVMAAQRVAHAKPRAATPTRVRRRPPSATTERGYGWQHQKARMRFLAEMHEGDPCARCEKPMFKTEPLDLDHTDDRNGYRGLAHRACNRATAGRRRNQGDPLPYMPGAKTSKCPVCGGAKRADTLTCGRACGWEWRRRNAA